MQKSLTLSRREFVCSMAGGVLAAAGFPRRAAGEHPDPRPGITGEKVLSAEQLKDNPDLIPLFDGIRAIPEIADGIRCTCGCAGTPGYRSLLSCFEADGPMAVECRFCQQEGRMVVRLRKQERTLQQIRDAVDARFG